MSEIVLLAVLFLATTAFGGEAWLSPSRDIAQRPNSLPGVAFPTDGTLESRGWLKVSVPDCDAKYWLRDGDAFSEMSQEEKDVVDAAEAEATAEAEALAGLPTVFQTGIAVVDDEGHHIELVPDMQDAVVVPVQVSNSPLTPEQRAEMKAEAKANRDAKKAAKAALKASISGAKNDKDKLAAIIAWIEEQ